MKTNREILLNGIVTIEQFDDNGNEIDPISQPISLYPDAVDDALKRWNTEDDVLTQLVDNISDIAEQCVVSYSVENEKLQF